MALKLGRLFDVSPELWMGIQADYDLETARLSINEGLRKWRTLLQTCGQRRPDLGFARKLTYSTPFVRGS